MSTTTETTTNLPKFLRIDSNPEDKANVQNLRSRFKISEKQLVHALLTLASNHDAQLLGICLKLQKEAEDAKKAARSPEAATV